MLSSLNPRIPPPFYELDEYTFQDLCCDLLHREESIGICNPYGTRGQRQRGIDLWGQSKDGQGIEVGQCKRYEQFEINDLKKASEDFLGHWDFWKEFQVRRFILLVACAIEKTQIIEEIDRQKDAFADYGISYEVWDSRTLRVKLGRHVDIARRYIRDEYWFQNITGKAGQEPLSQPVITSYADLKQGLIEQQLEKLNESFSQKEAIRLDEIRELYRRGKMAEAYHQLLAYPKEDSWVVLKPSLQARVLRTLATYELNLNSNLEQACALEQQASRLDPTGDDLIIRLLLRLYDEGYEAALGEIPDWSNLNAFNLRLLLLLELGRTDDVLTHLTQPPSSLIPDAETKRLHALALLVSGRITEAQREISAALAERSDWIAVRAAAAMVDYFSCLPLSHLPHRLVPWPEPLLFSLVKSDDDSLERLRRAGEEFAYLAASQRDYPRERGLYETWRLACLAAHSASRESAAEYCHQLIDRDPSHHRAVLWAIGCNFRCDLSQCESALKSAIRVTPTLEVPAKIERITALIALYFHFERYGDALTLLNETKADFLDIGGSDNWHFWYGQALVNLERAEEVIQIGEGITDLDLRHTLIALTKRKMAFQTGDRQPLLEYLEGRLNETGESEVLLELCALKAELNQWDFILDHADKLIPAVGSADVVRLCASAAWNSGKPAKFLSLLDSYRHLFPQQTFSDDLCQARVVCLVKTGDIVGAVNEASALVARSAATSNLMVLFNAQHRKGDLNGMTTTARKLAERDDLPSAQCARLASVLRAVDLSLAREFWIRAGKEAPDDPELIGYLSFLGFQLNLEKEASPLLKQSVELANRGEGSFQVTDLASLSKLMRTQFENDQKIDDLYGKGEIPLHFFAQRRKIPLADLLHGHPEISRRQTDLRSATKVLIQHGGRPSQDALIGSSQKWRLHLDITALMLAESIGILDLIEQHFSPMQISSHVQLALQAEMGDLLPHQPSRLESYQKILSLLEEKQLSAIGPEIDLKPKDEELARKLGVDRYYFFHHAQESGGFAVDHWPLTAYEDEKTRITLPNDLAACVTNCRDIIESLKSAGRLTDSETEQALSQLGSSGQAAESMPCPPLGATLILCNNLADVFAGAGLLEILCKHFKVFVDADEIARAKDTIREFGRRAELREWVKRLLSRINSGLDKGIFQTVVIPDTVPQHPDAPEEIESEKAQCLEALLRCEVCEDAVLVFDDRLMNRFQSRENNTPIISLLEVMEALRLRGVLSEEQHYATLLKMRAGNLRYIPITSAEILFHLKQTKPNTNGLIAETFALSVLRRYLSACLLDKRWLRIPPLPEEATDKQGEMNFVIGAQRAISNAIIEVWADPNLSVEAASAQADWVFRNLHTGGFGVLRLLPNSEQWGDGLQLVGQDIGGFLVLAHQIDPLIQSGEERTRRKAFYAWLEDRVLVPRLKANPEVIGPAAETLKRIATAALSSDYGSPVLNEANHRLLQNLFLDLPPAFQEIIAQDSNLFRGLLLQRVNTVFTGHGSFPAQEFTSALERAFAGRRVIIKAREPEAEFTIAKLGLDDSGDTVFEVVNSDGETVGQISDPVWEMTSSDPKHRKTILYRHHYLFDCEERLLRKTIGRISAQRTAARRVALVQEWQKKSAENFYRRLETKFLHGEEVKWADLFPEFAAGMLRHLRLDQAAHSSFALTGNFEHSARTLLKEEGLVAALDRLATLPIKLPRPIIAAFLKLSDGQRRQLLNECRARWGSPVSRLHLIDLTLHAARENEQLSTTAGEILGEIYDDQAGLDRLNLFQSILLFVNDEFSCRKDISQLPPEHRLLLVWLHASKLHNIFHRRGFDCAEMEQTLRLRAPHANPDMFTFELVYFNDVLHPRRFNRAIFLTHGVAAALSEHRKALVDSAEMLELIRNAASIQRGDQPVLAVELFADPLLATDCLNSWLGGDRGQMLNGILEPGSTLLLCSEALRSFVRSLIGSLRENPVEADLWWRLHGVVRNLPVYEELHNDCQRLLSSIDLVQVYESNYDAGLAALVFVSSQLIYHDDGEIRSRTSEALKVIARRGAKRLNNDLMREPTTSLMDTRPVAILIETARLITLHIEGPLASSRAFYKLQQEIFDDWPELRDEMAPGLWPLTRELPVSNQAGLWPVILSCRAARRDSI